MPGFAWFASGDRINALDPENGKIERIIDVPAFAGTSFDGQHFFQTAENRIQKIDPKTGEVLEQLDLPPGMGVSGLESNGTDRFFCGGGKSGKVRAVRRPRRSAATDGDS